MGAKFSLKKLSIGTSIINKIYETQIPLCISHSKFGWTLNTIDNNRISKPINRTNLIGDGFVMIEKGLIFKIVDISAFKVIMDCPSETITVNIELLNKPKIIKKNYIFQKYNGDINIINNASMAEFLPDINNNMCLYLFTDTNISLHLKNIVNNNEINLTKIKIQWDSFFNIIPEQKKFAEIDYHNTFLNPKEDIIIKTKY